MSLSASKHAAILAWTAVLTAVTLFFAVPFPKPFFRDPFSHVLLGREGELLGAKVAADGQWRFPETSAWSEKFTKALIHFEDKRFFRHPGVDPLAVARALWLNVRAGRRVSGGSTITMQVVRLLRRNGKRTYLEKFIEAMLALKLELHFSKREILGLYANHAPFGGNVVGIGAAARRYFGRSVKELTWAEAALLAVLPNSPSLIRPGRNRSVLKGKRNRLLARLAESGAVTPLEYELAVAEPIPVRPGAMPRLAPRLFETLVLKRKAEKSLFQGPMNSTLNRGIQIKTAEVLRQNAFKLASKGIHNAGAVIVDNKTMEVLAYVGNTGPPDTGRHSGQVDVVRRPRSTGSILKPFLYAAMLQYGEILPETLVPDVPTRYGGFIPENFDREFRGAVPAKTALVKSLNIPAARMLSRFGLHRFYDFLERMGLTSLHRNADDYGLTLILGGAEGTLWDIAGMYANLARLASEYSPAGRLKYRRLRILSGEPAAGTNEAEMGPGAAWLTLRALQKVERPGVESFWRNFAGSKEVAWKTGTSYGLRDGWAVGCTPGHTAAVWTGNADGEGRPGLTGISAAAPILFDILNFLPDTGAFKAPEYDLRTVKICRKSGYMATDLCEHGYARIPDSAGFVKTCPWHLKIHLDKSGRYRVHGNCESVTNMVHRSSFVLPPVQEHWYKKHNPAYKPPPPFRKDCAEDSQSGPAGVMAVVYPTGNTGIYIPVDIDGKRGEVVFEAVHRRAGSVIYWHMDETYLGLTRRFHQMTAAPSPGTHRLILVDDQGNSVERRFRVLNADADDADAR